MLTTIIVFCIKVYVYGKLLDAIEDVGKGLLAKVAMQNLRRKNDKKGNDEQIIETYFVD